MTATIFLALALIAQPDAKPNAADSALTIEVVRLDAVADGLVLPFFGGTVYAGNVYAVYRVRNTSRVALHHLSIVHVYRDPHLSIVHVYRDPAGKLIGKEGGGAVIDHLQPGKVSKVWILMKSIPLQGGVYVDIRATANRKEVKITEKN